MYTCMMSHQTPHSVELDSDSCVSLHLHLSHLADALIQSDLVVRLMSDIAGLGEEMSFMPEGGNNLLPFDSGQNERLA
jgi:hypothetical protein